MPVQGTAGSAGSRLRFHILDAGRGTAARFRRRLIRGKSGHEAINT